MLLGDVYFKMFTVRLFTTWKKPTEFGWECQQDWLRIMVRIDYYLNGCMVEQNCKNNITAYYKEVEVEKEMVITIC